MSDPEYGEYRRRRGPQWGCIVVLVFLLGFLTMLLMPVINMVRAASAKMLCGANLRKLVIAAHNYHNDFNRLPTGYLGPKPNEADPSPANGPHIGWLAELMPYLGIESYPTIEPAKGLLPDPKLPDPPVEAGWWTHGGRLGYAMAKMQMLRCPLTSRYSDGEDGQMGMVVALHHYHVGPKGTDPGVHQVAWVLPLSPTTRRLGMTTYVGVSGAAGGGTDEEWGKYSGILVNRRSCTLGTITAQDGCSNTLMVGESLGGYANGERTILHTWMGSGAMGVYQGLAREKDHPSPHQFSSAHPAVVQFSFADGSVRGIRPGYPSWDGKDRRQERLKLLYELAGRRDGESADTYEIME